MKDAIPARRMSTKSRNGRAVPTQLDRGRAAVYVCTIPATCIPVLKHALHHVRDRLERSSDDHIVYTPGASAAACHNKGVVLVLSHYIGPPAAAAVALGAHAGHAAAEHAQALAPLQPEQAAHDGATAAIPA